jgi:hypothetical protein
VEGAAYDLFCAFLKETDHKIRSVVFHNIQSFDSKIGLLDRCAYFAIPNGPLRVRWYGVKKDPNQVGLKTRISDQLAIRNRIVHFRFHCGVDKNGPSITLGPSYFDATYAINDKWKKPDSKIDLNGLKTAQKNFGNLADDLGKFKDDYLEFILA